MSHNGQVDAAPSSTVQQTPALDDVRRIVLDAVGDHALRVVLFGSWARGEPRRSSDVDVAVRLAPGAPKGILARLRDDLQRSNVPYRVDVVDWDEVPEALRENIDREGVEWTA